MPSEDAREEGGNEKMWKRKKKLKNKKANTEIHRRGGVKMKQSSPTAQANPFDSLSEVSISLSLPNPTAELGSSNAASAPITGDTVSPSISDTVSEFTSPMTVVHMEDPSSAIAQVFFFLFFF